MGKRGKRRKSKKSTGGQGRQRTAGMIFKRVAAVALVLLLAGAGVAFGYVKYVEGKMRPAGLKAQAIAAVISDPKPTEPVNFLILGADENSDGSNGRSDTIVIAHVDFQNRKATMVSIPRDSRVEIPGYGTDKINAAFAYGGAALTIKTIEQWTGIQINHYVSVDFNGFTKMVDALGGVDVTVQKRMVDSELGDPIDAGPQHMDGTTALHYVRFRNTELGDFTRIADQQNFARSLLQQSEKFQTVFKLPTLLSIMGDNVETDMTMTELLTFAGAARSFTDNSLTTVMLPGTTANIDGVSYVIPTQDKIDLITAAIVKNEPIDPSLLSAGTS
jgi:polyisoprenyl-teichoic acid--peptidoglycan teichoic acid transferase